MARWGPELGREATIDALVYGWRHWPKVRAMVNPVGYLYTIGRHSVAPPRSPTVANSSHTVEEPWAEPELERGLQSLSESQRAAVVLHHSFSWTYREIAEVLGVRVSTVRNHIDRGMRKLRAALGVEINA